MATATKAFKASEIEPVFNCPVCGMLSENSTHRYTFGEFPLVRCGNFYCETDYLIRRPTEKAMEAHYSDQSYYQSDDGIHGYFDYESEKDAVMTTVGRRLEKASNIYLDFITGYRLLELGGALGFGCLKAREMGYEPVLCEMSAYARQRAFALGVPAIHPKALKLLGDESMDVVMAWDTLEHVYDLHALVAEVHRVLSPRGVFLFNVPETGSKSARLFRKHWWAYREPEHLVYLTPKSVRSLLHRFTVVDRTQDYQYMTLGGAALRFGRMMPRWLAPTMGGLSYQALRLIHLKDFVIKIPHGLRMYIAVKRGD